MTGLDPSTDRLLEIACIVTTSSLIPLDRGVSYVIRTSPSILSSMSPWCIQQHGSSGLTSACSSGDSAVAREHADVRAAVLAYVRDRVPAQGAACLAGNTVHADKAFLAKEMPELVQHLHYRIVDVSTIKELVRRWYGEGAVWRGGKGEHRALEDIMGSIRELRYYRKNVFGEVGVVAEKVRVAREAEQ